MFLKKATAYHFRNYEKLSLEFNKPINVFTGDNGQGKSSALEAIYCGLRGKSFQPFISSQFIQNDKEQAETFLKLEEEAGLSNVLARFFPSETSLKKEIFYCGKKVSPSFLEKKFPVLSFTEASMKCLRQGPEQRRAFVDDLLCFGEQKRAKDQFLGALKQKKSLLKKLKQKSLSLEEARPMAEALNQKFLELSFKLVEARLERLKSLFSGLKELREEFFKKPLPELSFSYAISENKELGSLEEIPLLLREDLERKSELEMQTGILLSGPQRHEIKFLFKGENTRTFCSKGEQRIYMLSLLASQIQEFPQAFLFLDDVLLELDEKTQLRLLKFLEKKHCQTFLTNSKVISFKTKNMSFFDVKNGTIKRYD